MANEAVLITKYETAVGSPIADATGVEKGTILKQSGANVAAADGADQYAAGVLAYEKIASDGITQAAVYKRGRFRGTLSGSAVNAGDALGTSVTPNMLKAASSVLSGARIIGRAVEAASTGQTFLWELNIETALA